LRQRAFRPKLKRDPLGGGVPPVSATVRLAILRLGGALLVVLGALHLAVTPIIAGLISRNATAAEAWLTPPMLLNHVVVGLLLLPLGGLTIYAAPYAARGERWALVVSRATALSVAGLVITVFAFMGTRYFGARPFVAATSIVTLAAVTLLAAAFWPLRNAA
jgi:hypothetical protein